MVGASWIDRKASIWMARKTVSAASTLTIAVMGTTTLTSSRELVTSAAVADHTITAVR